MNGFSKFRREVDAILKTIDPSVLSYNESEFWMVQSVYEYVDFYATENKLLNTAIALRLARGLHDGVHRKLTTTKDGVSYRLPYLIHPLIVCRMLIDIQVPFTDYEKDILLAASLCHDMIEDVDFPKKGIELYTDYHLDPMIYEIVRMVSKRYDFTDEEERDFFHTIESNKFSALIKLSDRSNNVEDLYNMSVWKVHEYVGETNKFFLPMCTYAKANHHGLEKAFEILEDKILCLTHVALVLVERYDEREKTLMKQSEELRKENEELHKKLHLMMDEGEELL